MTALPFVVGHFWPGIRTAIADLAAAPTWTLDTEVVGCSQGADRELRVPQDLMRFRELPMQVRYMAGGSGEGASRCGVQPRHHAYAGRTCSSLHMGIQCCRSVLIALGSRWLAVVT